MDLVNDEIELPLQVTVYTHYADGRIEAWHLGGEGLRRPEMREEPVDPVLNPFGDQPLCEVGRRPEMFVKIPFNRAQYAPSLRDSVPDRQGCTCDGPVQMLAGILHQDYCQRKSRR